MDLSNKDKGWSIAEGFLIVFLITISIEFFCLIFTLLINSIIFLSGLDDSPILINYIMLLGRGLALFIILRYFFKKSNLKCIFKQRFKKKISLWQLFFGVLLLIGYILTYSTSIDLLLSNVQFSQTFIDGSNNLLANPTYALISSVLFAPIYEEIIYRGMLLEKLSVKYNIYTSIVVSALVFAISHLNFQQGMTTFFLGLILGFIYIKTRSLLMSISIHLINNLYFILSIFIPDIPSTISGTFNIYKLVVGLSLLLLGLLFFNKTKKSKYLISF
ncbi:CPBP family intramembrane glutamic endopeptidase [Clostridium sp. YIM B02551]|uniref:CPBP family intramembrane glutamic endopeptidase n=1 Tax=Clostridium sp. YIM B02551 TaxID=2910679 RepID=UPI001EEB1190|nr:type II CAAX endopeptidase family protein [Clostridium sp. YIM B02551]